MADTKADKAPELVKVYHPTIGGVVNEVASGDVDKWQAQGWLKSAPSDPPTSI